MLKKELAELLKSAKDDDNIDEIISKSDLGKTLLSSGLSMDAFKSKLSSDPTFKSFMDSEKDKHLQKGIETFKTNNLTKLVDDEVKKRFPDVDPKDQKVKEMELKIEQMQKDTDRKELINKAFKVATEKKLPTELVDFLVGADEETTNKNLETLVTIFSKHDETLKTNILKDNAYVPPAGGGGGKAGSMGLKLATQGKESNADMQAAKDSYFK